MKFIMGEINGHYLRDLMENCATDTERVLAAVAYATDARLLFDWCWDSKTPLEFYGRLDADVAVSYPVLKSFFDRKSPDFVCKLVQHHHAKVIWWQGYGVYIGSANLTDAAWYKNIEAGYFFDETEIDYQMEIDLNKLFSKLKKHATPLTEEVLNKMKSQTQLLTSSTLNSNSFKNTTSFVTWSGLSRGNTFKTINDKNKYYFLKEWHETLQELRDIGHKLNQEINRPLWISEQVPTGVQTDQFLHAYYYKQASSGNRALYNEFHAKNKNNKTEALNSAIAWWKTLAASDVEFEAKMINETAPFLRAILSHDGLQSLSYDTFQELCMSVHATRDHARRVRNKAVNLPDDGTSYDIPQKVEALSKRIWRDRSLGGFSITDVLRYVLYDGSEDQLPERLWNAVTDSKWKIAGLGISSLGEIVGWALPDKFPPRNGRTSKALTALGYDVAIHSG